MFSLDRHYPKQKRTGEAWRSLGEVYGVRQEAEGKTANPSMPTSSTEAKGVFLVSYLYFRIRGLCALLHLGMVPRPRRHCHWPATTSP